MSPVRSRSALVAVLLVAVLPLLAAPAAKAADPVMSWGYVAMPDGTQLRYTLSRPAEQGTWPTLLSYDGYTAGTDGPGWAQWQASSSEYAHLSVQARGSGCSSGTYQFMGPQWGRDGRDVVAWITRQPWSTGKVGMIGLSLPGITQLMVAGQAPKGLVAIAPGKAEADLYRGIARPGGLVNRAWVTRYENGLPSLWADSAKIAADQGDTACAANMAGHPITAATSLIKAVERSPYLSDPYWRDNDLVGALRKAKLAVLATNAWQDDNVGGLATTDYFRLLDHDNLWAIYANGYHDPVGAVDGTWTQNRMPQSSDRWGPLYSRFFDHFLRGKDNGWEKTPHVQVLQDVSATGHAAWTDTYSAFPPPKARAVALYARRGATLSATAPRRRGAGDRYAAPKDSAALGYALTGQIGSWATQPENGGSLAYTTATLTKDVSIAGPVSADLWLASTATDTDLQATLSEIRPDGSERYLQRGWLRASQRAIDTDVATPTWPQHPFTRTAAANLKPGVPSLARVQVVPLAHVFREGTRIRLTVDSPTAATSLDAFDVLPGPATNTILHDAAHPTRLVLPVVPGARAKAPLPACDAVRAEPCRAVTGALPAGGLDPSRLTATTPAVTSCTARTQRPDRRRAIAVCLRATEPVRVVVSAASPRLRASAAAKAGARTRVAIRLPQAIAARAGVVKLTVRTQDGWGNRATREVRVRVRP